MPLSNVLIILMGILDDIGNQMPDIDELFQNPFSSSLAPYLIVLGNTFYAFVWFFMVGMLYLKTNNLVMIVGISVMFFAFYAVLFWAVPIIVQIIAVLTAMVLTTLIYKVFIDR